LNALLFTIKPKVRAIFSKKYIFGATAYVNTEIQRKKDLWIKGATAEQESNKILNISIQLMQANAL
jgi:hypothetical protein